jgi:hypothetical protein
VDSAAVYRRHEPERTALYAVVEAQLETALEQARLRSEHGFGYPVSMARLASCGSRLFVERTFRDYLACGRRELGFTRVRCAERGFERLLAFSCKRRGLCPSCEGRRMADTAAHLVDRVLPVVPYRQWVLSLPIPVRLLLAREPALIAKTLRIFTQRLFRHAPLPRRSSLRHALIEPCRASSVCNAIRRTATDNEAGLGIVLRLPAAAASRSPAPA